MAASSCSNVGPLIPSICVAIQSQPSFLLSRELDGLSSPGGLVLRVDTSALPKPKKREPRVLLLPHRLLQCLQTLPSLVLQIRRCPLPKRLTAGAHATRCKQPRQHDGAHPGAAPMPFLTKPSANHMVSHHKCLPFTAVSGNTFWYSASHWVLSRGTSCSTSQLIAPSLSRSPSSEHLPLALLLWFPYRLKENP